MRGASDSRESYWGMVALDWSHSRPQCQRKIRLPVTQGVPFVRLDLLCEGFDRRIGLQLQQTEAVWPRKCSLLPMNACLLFSGLRDAGGQSLGVGVVLGEALTAIFGRSGEIASLAKVVDRPLITPRW